MRFSFAIFTLVLAGLAAAAPSPSPYGPDLKTVRRSLGASNVLEVFTSINQQVAGIQSAIGSTLTGINQNSPAGVKANASKLVNHQLATLVNVLTGGTSNLTSRASNAPPLQKRDTPSDTQALISAITVLVQMIESIVLSVVTALGLAGPLAPLIALVGPVTSLLLAVVAVVVDFLPFLGPIGQFIGGIGSLLSGIGSLIPKPG